METVAGSLCQSADTAPRSTAPPTSTIQRYPALDAFRGFIMLTLISGGFGLAAVAKHRPAFVGLANQFEHRPWEWIACWDLIQPAFMFMVGVAMPFALARRLEQGATKRQLFWHVAGRSFRLLLLSQVLMSVQNHQLFFQLTNVLAQIAFTYFFCYLIMQLRFRWQALIACAILLGHWLLFVAFPGTEGPYSKSTNVGAQIDYFLFGIHNAGYWVSINFITSTATTLFGVWTGELLKSPRTPTQKIRILAVSATACLTVGLILHPWNPIVKRICTTSFTIYSTGWILVMLLGFYWIIEVQGFRKWTYPLIVVGANSIFIYAVDEVLRGWMNQSITVFTKGFTWLGDFAPVAQSCTLLLAMWSLCFWLYRRNIFFKL